VGHILSLFTYLLTTSVSGRVPGYPSYYPTGTRVINYPDTAALVTVIDCIDCTHFYQRGLQITVMSPPLVRGNNRRLPKDERTCGGADESARSDSV